MPSTNNPQLPNALGLLINYKQDAGGNSWQLGKPAHNITAHSCMCVHVPPVAPWPELVARQQAANSC